jgi:flagellar biogenesis protein FliO
VSLSSQSPRLNVNLWPTSIGKYAMTSLTRHLALAAIILSTVESLRAEPADGLPEWNDQASVYLTKSQKAETSATANGDTEHEIASLPESAPTAAPPIVDAAIVPAIHEAPVADATAVPAAQEASSVPTPARTDPRQLAPRSARTVSASDGSPSASSAASRRLAEFGLPTQSLLTVGSALAIVIGAFLLFAWAIRRSGRKMASRGQLPPDVVSVLGRVPLAARQFAELLRVGNKLILVSLTPGGAETLTEVTDPAEVDRLVGLCSQSNPYSTTKAFEQVFQQMSTEPAPSGFLGNEGLMASLASPAGAYHANRGGMSRG